MSRRKIAPETWREKLGLIQETAKTYSSRKFTDAEKNLLDIQMGSTVHYAGVYLIRIEEVKKFAAQSLEGLRKTSGQKIDAPEIPSTPIRETFPSHTTS